MKTYQLTAIDPFVIRAEAQTAGEIIDCAAIVDADPHIPTTSLTVWQVAETGERTINESLSQMAREGITSADVRRAMAKILPPIRRRTNVMADVPVGAMSRPWDPTLVYAFCPNAEGVWYAIAGTIEYLRGIPDDWESFEGGQCRVCGHVDRYDVVARYGDMAISDTDHTHYVARCLGCEARFEIEQRPFDEVVM